ncbi:MAG TPA: hypothetical protein VFF79_13025 [Conexibacter sp.]|jgi:hypothetical protein|nr:hypothetical protein [Conexibacter sp.]
MPSPEQIQAAMPAMREWLVADAEAGRHLDDPRASIERALDWTCAGAVEAIYPGGVAQFIKDQEERRG